MVMANGSSPELHVLAVDDSLVERVLIERLLKSFSCKVTVVDSGRRALQILGLDDEKKSSVGFDALKVNLIMTDYSMPGMTGYELLKKIKESSAFREVPVVIMSSERILARINRCLEEGAEDFLAKPVKPSDVKRLKESLIRGGELDKNGTDTKKRPRVAEDAIWEQSSSLSPTHTCYLGQPESVVGDHHVAPSGITLLGNAFAYDQGEDQSVRGDADHAISQQPSSLSPLHTCALGQSESILEDNHFASSKTSSLQNTLVCNQDHEQSLRESSSLLSSTYPTARLVAYSSKRLKIPDLH